LSYTKFYNFLTLECTYLCVLSWLIVRMRLGLRHSTRHRKRRSKHLHDHADVNARIRVSIVLTSCRRSSQGRRTYRTPPGIDGWKFLDLFCRYELVFGCYIVIEYCYLCLDAILWWKFVDLLSFVSIKLCFDASSEKLIVLICYVSKTCSGYGWWGPEFQQHLGVE
jgi:hypothetical protein